MAFVVECEGNFENIKSFLKDKVNCINEINESNNNKIIVKINESGESDDLIFFNDTPVGDGISMIFKVKHINK
jgi:hypothetical protein